MLKGLIIRYVSRIANKVANKSLHPTANRLGVVGVVTILHYSIDCPFVCGSG